MPQHYGHSQDEGKKNAAKLLLLYVLTDESGHISATVAARWQYVRV